MPSNDPNWNSVAMLLLMDDTGLTDVKGRSVTKAGNVARSSTQSKFGGYSAVFDGSGDYLQVPASADWFFGTGAFTIECWVYIAGNSAANGSGLRNATIYTNMNGAAGGFAFQIQGNGSTTGTGIGWEDKYGGSNIAGNWATTVTQNEWHHVAVCREAGSSNLILCLDGTVQTSAITGGGSRSLGSASYAVQVGGQPLVTNWNQYLNGYVDDLRVTLGVARYTANYTPPAATFPLYGRYIGGTLTEATPHTEFKVRAYRLDTGALLNETIASGSSYEVPGCLPVAPYTDFTGPVIVTAHPRMSGVWQAAATKAVGDYAIPTAPETVPYVYKVSAIGVLDAGAANVKLLMHFEGTDDSTTGFVDQTGKTVTPAGNVKHENTQKKFGSTSGYFDGSGDYLTISDSALSVSSGDFTAEFFVYITSLAAVNGLLFWGSSSSNANRVQCDVKTDGSIAFYVEDGSAANNNLTSAAGVISTNTWYHVAIVRDGSTMRLFVNGASVATPITQTVTVAAASTLYLGLARNSGSARYLTGYMDELRVTVGTARYTADFTAPSSAFPFGTGSSEPTWPTTPDETVDDNDVTWTCVGAMVRPVAVGPLIPSL